MVVIFCDEKLDCGFYLKRHCHLAGKSDSVIAKDSAILIILVIHC